MSDRIDHDNEQSDRVERVNGSEPRRRRTVGESLRVFVVLALLAGLVLVALDNRATVQVGYVFGDVKAPIWIVLAAAAVSGVVIGWLARHRPHRRA